MQEPQSRPAATRENLAIIDGHAHLGPREIGDEYSAMGSFYSAEQLIRSMDANGIKMATVFAMRRLDDYNEANQYVASSAKKS